MNPDTIQDTRLRGHWLLAARFLWLAGVGLALVVFSAALPVYVRQQPLHLSPVVQAGLTELGFTVGGYVVYQVVMHTLLLLIFVAVSLVLLWRKPDDGMILLVTLMLITVSVNQGDITDLLKDIYPVWRLPRSLLWALGYSAGYLLVFLFPTGRFVPRWTAVVGSLVVATELYDALLPGPALFPGMPESSLLRDIIWLLFPSIGVGAQIYRYHYVSGPVQRQQTKWILFTFTVSIFLALVQTVAELVFPALRQPGVFQFLYQMVSNFRDVLMMFFIVCCMVIAILRYRLWDIDIVIRRTVAYTLLTGLLALIYLSSVVVLQGLARLLTGSAQNQWVSVVSTLAIAGLFNPLRRRVQDGIDRRFHRRRYDAAQVVAAFTAACHNEVELARLTEGFGRVMGETLQPAQVGLWLKPTSDRKPSSEAVLMSAKASPSKR